MIFSELEPFLDKKRRELLAALDAFGPEERHLSEYEGGWNPAQIIEHLSIVEEQVIAEIGRLLSGEAVRPSEPEDRKRVDVMALFEQKGLLGTPKTSPPSAFPTGKVAYEDGLERLAEVRGRLKALLPLLAARETNSLVSRHPLGVELNACQWLQFSAVHEWGHIHQLKRIRKVHSG
ncbi:DinB family protein [Paenibacillus sp. UNC499MF]|uniref:DinB family protein n=1 Tax=Paenibacillus sp. UNC499MF TaxID=1502751 RepID=UPI0008A0540C|nr:DinB family protein [Paenibacillus sp. UNC499MF]SEG68817.1 DinB superfamily protein [Paenibacillus sp. UNC499MF]